TATDSPATADCCPLDQNLSRLFEPVGLNSRLTLSSRHPIASIFSRVSVWSYVLRRRSFSYAPVPNRPSFCSASTARHPKIWRPAAYASDARSSTPVTAGRGQRVRRVLAAELETRCDPPTSSSPLAQQSLREEVDGVAHGREGTDGN